MQADVVDNHLVTMDVDSYPDPLRDHADQLAGRSMLVRSADRFDVECVVRGYLIGSGWRDYVATGAVCGIELPTGLEQAARLPAPIFTPATKADSGHDENISVDEMASIVGADWARRLEQVSIELYRNAAAYALERGIIIADTKFEFGIVDGELILIDEALTPDSSRFWPASEYAPGQSPPSFDKQFVRDYLDSLDWDHSPPAPSLPDEIVGATSRKYLEAYERLTGTPLVSPVTGGD
jgi:phosphoribosylaminoimidazole-succinocarboxamide synthase